MIHGDGGRREADGGTAGWMVILGSGYDSFPVAAGSPGFNRPLACSFRVGGTGSCWSGGLGQGSEAFLGGDDGVGPGPGRGDHEPRPAAAADKAGGGAEQWSDAAQAMQSALDNIQEIASHRALRADEEQAKIDGIAKLAAWKANPKA